MSYRFIPSHAGFDCRKMKKNTQQISKFPPVSPHQMPHEDPFDLPNVELRDSPHGFPVVLLWFPQKQEARG